MNLSQSVQQFRALRSERSQATSGAVKARAAVVQILAAAGLSEPDTRLSSARFLLLDVPTHFASTPVGTPHRNEVLRYLQASADSDLGIVMDLNRHKAGRTPSGYVPPVIVIAGEAAVAAARLAGRDKVRVWVGALAAARLKLIHADHQMGASELNQAIQSQLNTQYGNSDGTVAPSGVWIQEVFPFENYCIVHQNGRLFRQRFAVDMASREVALVGELEPVTQRYVDIAARGTPRRRAPLDTASRLYAGLMPTQADLRRNVGLNGDVKADFSGVPAPQRTTEDVARKSRGASNSEMAQKLRNNNKPGKDPTDDVDAEALLEGERKVGGMRTSGYVGYGGSTDTQRRRTKGATGSEMAPRLKGAADFRNRDFVKRIVTRFRAACKGGYKPKMAGSAPKGWEGTVERMKDHPEISNPFALAHWMNEEGYTPSRKGK